MDPAWNRVVVMERIAVYDSCQCTRAITRAGIDLPMKAAWVMPSLFHVKTQQDTSNRMLCRVNLFDEQSWC